MTKRKFSIRWKSKLWSEGSSAIISREMILALSRLGCSISVHNLSPDQQQPLLLNDINRLTRLQEIEKVETSVLETFVVRCAAPETYETDLIEGYLDITPNAQANITFFTLPYGYLPPDISLDTGNRLLAQIWGCSHHVVDTLIARGFDPVKVRRIPLGYAPDIFHPDVTPMKLSTPKRFRFVHVSIPYMFCKGIDVLLRAYIEEFDEDDDTCLILQSRPQRGWEQRIVDFLKAEMSRTKHRPEVLLLLESVDQPSLASLYKASSCYVQTSRCEGFGMPILEAMACGIPTIAINYGGHLEMCTPDTSYLVDYELGPPPERAAEEGLSCIPWWAEPDLAQLRYWMRYAYEHEDEVRERGRVAAQDVRGRLTWQHAAQEAIAALEELV
jgi:glycosyltransferase involved in cell wall biosynthesis